MKYYLVTGVSSGIGKAITEALLKEGHFVFGSVRKEKDATALASTFGERFEPLLFDVTNPLAIEKAKEYVEQITNGAGLAGLVNNAGISVYGPLKYLQVSEFERQMQVNVYGVLHVIQAFLPLLGATIPATTPPGKIINISSVAGLFTMPFLIPYCASKKALEAISEGLRRELLPFNIDVVSILPGPVKTPIWEKAMEQKDDFAHTEYGEILKKAFDQMEAAKSKAIPPERIARLVTGIFKGKKNKTRYVMTANPLPLLVSKWLPPRWIDFFLKKMMTLQKQTD